MDTMNSPLISFNAEAENETDHQAADPAKMRYERMCNEAQLDIDKEVPPPTVPDNFFRGQVYNRNDPGLRLLSRCHR